VREDTTRNDSFQDNYLWQHQRYVNDVIVRAPPRASGDSSEGHLKFTSNSLSGRERNRLFLQLGDNFSDVTLVSGADDLADGRSFAVLDFDRDGWQDIALMSLNAPRFKLYRNQMGQIYPGNKSFRFRFVGGQTNAKPSSELSNRDGIGARVLVTFRSGKKVLVQNQAGEGFSSQNSATHSIGIPQGDSVIKLEIRWPSGKNAVIESPDNSQVYTINEVSK
jgi:hypothetical protein